MKLSEILVVDDDEVNNFILNELFIEHKVADKITMRSSVESAFEFLAESNAFPDLIILDINMPVKDGFDFLDEYYEKKYNQHPTQIILLTSSLFDKDRATAAKYDRVLDFVIKPLEFHKLETVISQISEIS